MYKMDEYLEIYTPIMELSKKITYNNNFNESILDLSYEVNNFKIMLQKLNIPQTEIDLLQLKQDIFKKYIFTSNEDEIDLIECVNDIRFNSNLLRCLKRCNLTQTELARTKEKALKQIFLENILGFQRVSRLKMRTIKAKQLSHYGKINNSSDFQNVLDKEPLLNAKITTLLKRIKNVYNVNETNNLGGDWINVSYPTNLTIHDLFIQIKEHAKRISGCWIINAEGTKQELYDTRCNKCSDNNIALLSNEIVVCVKQKFWIAAQDFLNDIFTISSQHPIINDYDNEQEDIEQKNEIHKHVECKQDTSLPIILSVLISGILISGILVRFKR